jgi:hypothetical protein
MTKYFVWRTASQDLELLTHAKAAHTWLAPHGTKWKVWEAVAAQMTPLDQTKATARAASMRFDYLMSWSKCQHYLSISQFLKLRISRSLTF